MWVSTIISGVLCWTLVSMSLAASQIAHVKNVAGLLNSRTGEATGHAQWTVPLELPGTRDFYAGRIHAYCRGGGGPEAMIGGHATHNVVWRTKMDDLLSAAGRVVSLVAQADSRYGAAGRGGYDLVGITPSAPRTMTVQCAAVEVAIRPAHPPGMNAAGKLLGLSAARPEIVDAESSEVVFTDPQEETLLLANQDFSFVGHLTDDIWTTLNTAISPIAANGSVATAYLGGRVNGQDIQTGFAAQGPAATTRAGIDFRVRGGAAVVVTAFSRFFELRDGTATGAAACTGLFGPAGSGDFRIGITTAGNTPTAFWGTDLSFDTTYRLVISYNAASGVSGVSIDGGPEIFSAPGTTGRAIEQLELRQSPNNNVALVVDVDNAVVWNVSDGAVLLANQDFSFVGDLTDDIWTTLNTAILPIAADGSVATLHLGGGVNGQDIQTGFAAQGPAATTWAGIDFRVLGGAAVDATAFSRFFELRDATGATARTGLFGPAGPGDFRIGITTGGNIPTAFWGTDLDFDRTYRLVISYNAGNGVSGVSIDGGPEIFSAPGTTGRAIEQLELRQTPDNSKALVVDLDNAVVSTTFEGALFVTNDTVHPVDWRPPVHLVYEEKDGIYMSTYGMSTDNPMYTNKLAAALALPYIKGIAHYQRWNALETDQDQFEWRQLDEAFELVKKHGKHIIIGIQAGIMSPAWLINRPDVQTVDFVHRNPGWWRWATQHWTTNISGRVYNVQRMPIPWDVVYNACLDRTLRKIAERYGGESCITFVNVCGPSVSGGVEANFNVDWGSSRIVDTHFDAHLGFTLDKYTAAWKHSIDKHLELFTNSMVGLATHHENGDYGFESNKIVQYSYTQQLTHARAIRDYLLQQHLKIKGEIGHLRNCGLNDERGWWGNPDTIADKPSSYFTALEWEVRDTANIGYECEVVNRNAGNNFTTVMHNGITGYGRHVEIKVPDILENPKPHYPYAPYRPVLEEAARIMANEWARQFTWGKLSGGNASGSWTNQANWSGGTQPTTISDTANFNAVDLTADSTVTLDGNQYINSLNFGDTGAGSAANWILNAGSPGSAILTLGGGYSTITVGNQATINAELAGGQGFAKLGAGTLTLNGANSYTGPTHIRAGMLLVNERIGGSGVSVSANARLGGNGVILSAVTLSGGAILAPGMSVGTLTINNNLTLNAGAVARFELNRTNSPAGNDYLEVSGALNVASSTLDVANLGPPLAAGDRFTLLSQPSSGFTTVNLPPLAEELAWTNDLAVDGSIAVTEASAYQAWAAGWGINIGAATNDFDGDRLANLCEYGLGGDPTNPLDKGTAPRLARTADAMAIVHVQRAGDSRLTYYLVSTADLVQGIWSNEGYTVTGTNVTGGAFNYVSNMISRVAAARVYYRLVISYE